MSRRRLILCALVVFLLAGVVGTTIRCARNVHSPRQNSPTYEEEMMAMHDGFAPMRQRISECMKAGDHEQAKAIHNAMSEERRKKTIDICTRHGKPIPVGTNVTR